MAGDQPRLFLFSEIQRNPKHFEEAKAALDQIIPPTLKESGCHVFAAFVRNDHSNTLHLFKRFKDEVALNTHYAQDFTTSVFKKCETWLSALVEVLKMPASSRVSWEQFHA
ncbi:hypothetical protein KHP62_21020 [Rhodobacteraceae bacterium NNCM2]|nr:hypothetical protein [Coraliihabitans acroporae]